MFVILTLESQFRGKCNFSNKCQFDTTHQNRLGGNVESEPINRNDHEKQFERLQPLLKGFSVRLRDLVEELTNSIGLSIHVVESRAKSKDSFLEKIQRPGKKYTNPLKEITDLVGCRIICYYRDDCQTISQMIRREFLVKEEELSHQPETLEADRFGYLSAHYIVSLSKQRSKLPEWAAYSDFVAEIQVRTVIQHAWSAVSHALQYKVESSVASSLQRRLNRLAGVFELADDEFVGIRDQRENEKKIAAAAIKIGDPLKLSPTTLEEFLKTWAGAPNLIDQAKRAGFTIDNEDPDSDQIDSIMKLCILCDIHEINHLISHVSGDYYDILKSIKESGTEEWHVDLDFVVTLVLIYKFRDLMSMDYLVSLGFHKRVAEEVFKGIDGM